jgi:hypothetical protein
MDACGNMMALFSQIGVSDPPARILRIKESLLNVKEDRWWSWLGRLPLGRQR